jgi:hypothetical protein
MASEWEMAMGVDLGMGMSAYHHHQHNASSITTVAPMSGHHGGAGSYSTAHHHYYGMPPMGDAVRLDGLLDFSNAGAHEFFPTAAAGAATENGHHSGAMGKPSPTANSSDHQASMLSFADEFYIPVSTKRSHTTHAYAHILSTLSTMSCCILPYYLDLERLILRSNR